MHIFGRLLLPCGSSSVFEHIQKFVQIRHQSSSVPVCRVSAANLFQLAGNKVLHLQHMLNQLQMRYVIRMGFS